MTSTSRRSPKSFRKRNDTRTDPWHKTTAIARLRRTNATKRMKAIAGTTASPHPTPTATRKMSSASAFRRGC